MSSHEQESFRVKLETAIEEARQRWAHLRDLLKEMVSPEKCAEALSVVDGEIMASFSPLLSLLDTSDVAEASIGRTNSLRSDEQRSEIPSFKRKIQPPRRSGYRRRAHPYTCKTVLRKDAEDGYTWRKYGQKVIFGAANQRSYYRCTHKHERGCQATRQVQKTEDNSMFSITYMGDHTCMNAKLPNQKSCFISFKSNMAGNGHQQEAPLPSTLAPSVKHECDEEVLSNHSPLSAASSAFPVFGEEGSAPVAHLVGTASDQYDVTSGFCSSSISSLDIEYDPGTSELDNIFDFSHGTFELDDILDFCPDENLN